MSDFEHDNPSKFHNFFKSMWPIYLVVLLVMIVWLLIGKYHNANMTELDVVNYTNSLGEKSTCYFNNVTVERDEKGQIKNLLVKDQDYKIEVTPFIDEKTKKVTAYKVSREQIMYCTQGDFNYKTPFITESRILSLLPPDQAKEIAKGFDKEKMYKRIVKIGSYFLK